MITVDLGSAIVIEATIQAYTPFGSYADADPISLPTISVWDNKGKKVVDAQSMIKDSTGKYYYTVQTLTTWKKGLYKSEITATFSSNSDVKTEVESFILE